MAPGGLGQIGSTQEAVKSLIYAMMGTRPDIAASVGVVSKYLANPGEEHWKAVKRIIRYLKGTASYGIKLGSVED